MGSAVGMAGSRLTHMGGKCGMPPALGVEFQAFKWRPNAGSSLKTSRPHSKKISNVASSCKASLTPEDPHQPRATPGQPEFSSQAGSWFDFDSSLASSTNPPTNPPRDSDTGNAHSDRGRPYSDTDSEHTGISSRGNHGSEDGEGQKKEGKESGTGEGRDSSEGRGPGERRSRGSRPPNSRAPRGSGSREGALPQRDLARVAGALESLGAGQLTGVPRAVHFSGCINESYTLPCERGKFFVKINRSFSASEMFEGEAAILQAIHSTKAVKVPVPLTAGDLDGGGSFLVLEHLAFRPFAMLDAGNQAALGEALAHLHLCTARGTDLVTAPADSDGEPQADSGIAQGPDTAAAAAASSAAASSAAGGLDRSFGFGCVTRLGVVPLTNGLATSWSDFFVEQRLEDRFQRALDYLAQVGPPENELQGLREAVTRRSKGLLEESEAQLGIRPSLLHGDLWLGNCGLVTGLNAPAIFDPAGFYGHAEFDLAFRGWEPQEGFPGFGDPFYAAYHSVLPKEPGFEERAAVYQLFHLLNHLVIYGWEYYSPSVKKCKEIIGQGDS